jgi:CubicO group peptidase (beta-lactamase class C family)
MGKMFTAVAIAQLAQAGKLSFDDALGKYLPDYPNAEVAKVTLHQLLTHTGGTGDIFGPEFMARRTQLKELRDYVALYGSARPGVRAGQPSPIQQLRFHPAGPRHRGGQRHEL